MKKTRDEIVQDILQRFEEQTDIVNIEPGTAVRTFSEVISEEFNQLYSEIGLVSTMAFVTTAKGQFLDLLGLMLNCYRVVGEEDNNFRIRITNQVYIIAGANQTSIRLKLLAIPGVNNIIMEEFTYGTGSFSVYIISDEASTSDDIMAVAREIVEDTKAFGIYAAVRKPVLIYLGLRVRLVFEQGTSLIEISNAKENIRVAIKNYADNIDVGGDFMVSEALRRMKNVSESISDLTIETMHLNQTQNFVRNVSANKGERIFLEHVTIV